MTRGNASQTKVHFTGKNEDFIIFVDDVDQFKAWKTDKSIPLAQFIGGFKIFVTHKHGAQGVLDGASKATLHAEFGTDDEDKVIKEILEKGSVQEVESAERQGPRNDSQGGQPSGRQ